MSKKTLEQLLHTRKMVEVELATERKARLAAEAKLAEVRKWHVDYYGFMRYEPLATLDNILSSTPEVVAVINGFVNSDYVDLPIDYIDEFSTGSLHKHDPMDTPVKVIILKEEDRDSPTE